MPARMNTTWARADPGVIALIFPVVVAGAEATPADPIARKVSDVHAIDAVAPECGYASYTFYDGELDTTEHIIALYQRSCATTRWRIVAEPTGSPHELIG